MNNSVTFIQSPRERLDYTFDFSGWLVDGEYLDQATVTVVPTTTPLTDLQVNDISYNTTLVNVYAFGGVAGKKYKIKCNVYSSNMQFKEAVIYVKVQEN